MIQRFGDIAMKVLILLVLLTVTSRLQASDPGAIIFLNSTAPTRLETLDGPLAGPGIWAQLLAGLTPDDLVPIGVSVEHAGQGIVYGGIVEALNIPCSDPGYVQMVAWDGYWGTELDAVPQLQLGFTDIVREGFGCQAFDPVKRPDFTQSAVVPLVPEPSTLVLTGLGLGGWLLVLGRRVLGARERSLCR